MSASKQFMLTNWLQRAAGFMGGADVPVEELLEEAARVRRVGVVIDPLAYMALSPAERDALELAPAYIDARADAETWADRARSAAVKGRKHGAT